MKVALIPPIPDLERFQSASRVHLALAHLAEEPDYCRFYAIRRTLGDYVILDNGACENEGPLDMQQLISIANRCRANELVLPDVQFSKDDTLWHLGKALGWLKVQGESSWRYAGSPRFMFVPQGENPEDWYDCYYVGRKILDRFRVDRPIIAVAKQYEQFEGGRLALVQRLREVGEPEVHLLGWAPPWESLLSIARFEPWVRSVDSAKPFNYAHHGVELRIHKVVERIPRPADYFHVPTRNLGLAHHNIEQFKLAAKGGEREDVQYA